MQELSIKTYAKHENLSIQKVNELVRTKNVQWRFLFPQTKEYKVINSNIDVEKAEVSQTELSKKAYALYAGITIQHVNILMKQDRLKWRYVYPETKEYVVIDTSFEFQKVLLKKE